MGLGRGVGASFRACFRSRASRASLPSPSPRLSLTSIPVSIGVGAGDAAAPSAGRFFPALLAAISAIALRRRSASEPPTLEATRLAASVPSRCSGAATASSALASSPGTETSLSRWPVEETHSAPRPCSCRAQLGPELLCHARACLTHVRSLSCTA